MDDIVQPELLSRLCRDVATFTSAEFAMAKFWEGSIVCLDESCDAIDGRHESIQGTGVGESSGCTREISWREH